MDSVDLGILCFQHEKNEPKCFCFNLPETCRFCNCDLMDSVLNILPFRVPFPFKSSSNTCNAIVIKPTKGDFLNINENFTDLHIGVTDSRGYVYEYDFFGIQKTAGSPLWKQCLPINVVQPMTFSLKQHWDKVLHETVLRDSWKKERYHPENHNCYSFVLSFLQSLQLEVLKPFVSDKVIFCQRYICPQTRIAAKYLTIFRKLKQNLLTDCVTFD